ncbi:MAG: HD domain-containing protein, partial [Planctomycetaceae bacterium]
ATIVAALLHDVGHLLHTLAADAPEQGIDDQHEELAARWLAGRFPPAVVAPVQLHVAAKRYLCAVEPAYHASLSPPSQLSLQLQGGPMTAAEVAAFERHTWFPCAVVLRRCDDAAKIPGASTPPLDDWLPLVDRQARQGGVSEAVV